MSAAGPVPSGGCSSERRGFARCRIGGGFPPDGRDYHVCFGTDGDLHVSEIWDSQEQFQAYGEVLMPILADVGIQFSGEPEVFEVHNIIKR